MGHPLTESLNGFIADEYEHEAVLRGHEVRVQKLGQMQFDPVLREGYKSIQALEPDLIQAQENLKWCNHWVLIYPVWWGSVPALLKGFLDRTLHPGFAFQSRKKGIGWDKLLKGRTAEIIATSDAPSFWLRFAYLSSDFTTLRNATLRYCGFSPVRTRRIDRVKFKTEDLIRKDVDRILRRIPKA